MILQPQITRDINKNDARRLYNGGDSGGTDTALKESDIPNQCFREVLWTLAQCRNWVRGGNVPGVTIFAGGTDRSPVKGCFYSVSRREAYWGNYDLNPSNSDYLTRVGEDFDNGKRVRIFCNNNVVPTSSPTDGKFFLLLLTFPKICVCVSNTITSPNASLPFIHLLYISPNNL